MPKLIDIHSHLDHPAFANDLDEVIQRAKEAGVKTIITAGIDPASNRKALELQKKYEIVKASLGIYPPSVLLLEAKHYTLPLPKPFVLDEEISFIRKHKNKTILIGEIGLDLNLTKDLREQQEVFFAMLSVAEQLKKAVVVHSRKAEQEVIDCLKSSNVKKVIMHCFMGNTPQIKTIADHGWYLSVPPHVVRSSHFQGMVKIVNINQLLTETDAPFLGPRKDERNEPAFVKESVAKIAELKQMEALEVENNIFMNFQKLI